MTTESSHSPRAGLSLAPFRALRYQVDSDRLARLLCPPYDVIGPVQRAELVAGDPDNAVSVILPEGGPDPYTEAARRLTDWVDTGTLAPDRVPALYVYEMREESGLATRGLIGAIELRDPDDLVILPHENTMAGPVADRLALMSATHANLEPIYLVYDGGGAASEVVNGVESSPPMVETRTPDGLTHRLWAITDLSQLTAIDADLSTRRALIADGHHRYATYRELQRQLGATTGDGPWDRGLTLLVDSTSYGPQVHAIHRVLVGGRLDDVLKRARATATVEPAGAPEAALDSIGDTSGFACVLADGTETFVVSGVVPEVLAGVADVGEPAALAQLDVSVLHRGLVPAWGLSDTPATLGYAHSIEEALAAARATGGTAVLLRPTPVAAVAAVAAAGARMPRKSTLFTPKPASGLLFRSLALG